MPVPADGTSRSPKPEGKDLVVAGQRPAGRSGCPVCHFRPASSGPPPGPPRASGSVSRRGFRGRVGWGILRRGGVRWGPMDSTGLSTSWFCVAVARAAVSVRWGHGDEVRSSTGGRAAGCGGAPRRLRRERHSPGRQPHPPVRRARPPRPPRLPHRTALHGEAHGDTPSPRRPPPAIPTAAKAHSKAGAEAFVRAYFAAFNRAWTEPTTAELGELSAQPSCKSCAAALTTAERLSGEEAAIRRASGDRHALCGDHRRARARRTTSR